MEQVDLDALFMEAYWLYKDGYDYSFHVGDLNEMKHLYQDYVQQSELELLLDEYFVLPDNKVWHVTSMDVVTALQTKYPSLSRKINAIALGKMLSERGFEMVKKGKRKLTTYAVSPDSKILQLMVLDNESCEINNPISRMEETLQKVNNNTYFSNPYDHD